MSRRQGRRDVMLLSFARSRSVARRPPGLLALLARVRSHVPSAAGSSIRPTRPAPEMRRGESAGRLGYRHQLLNRLVQRMAFGDDLIEDAKGAGILRRQEVIAVKRPLDGVVVLAGMADIHFVKPPLHLDDVLGMA